MVDNTTNKKETQGTQEQETSSSKGPLYLKVTLEGDVKKRFLLIKKTLGMESNSDIVRLFIFQQYEKLYGSNRF